jgi:hypothetical protein
MSVLFSLGAVAFIEDGIRRFMDSHDGRIPQAVMMHPEHLADVERELATVDAVADACRLFGLSLVLSHGCRVPVLFDDNGRQHEM